MPTTVKPRRAKRRHSMEVRVSALEADMREVLEWRDLTRAQNEILMNMYRLMQRGYDTARGIYRWLRRLGYAASALVSLYTLYQFLTN